MESKVKDGSYVSIQSFMIKNLLLKGNELIIYAIIYGFSQDGETKFVGSLRYLSDWTNSTKQGVMKCLKSLQEKGLIDKIEVNKNGVKFCEYYATEFNGYETKFNGGGKQSLTGGIKQSLPNNISLDNIDYNINNNIVFEKEKSFKNWTLEDFQNDIKKYQNETSLQRNDLIAFYDFFRELTPSGKMRFQTEKTWQTDLRLKRWEANKDKFGKPTQKDTTSEMKSAALQAILNNK